MKKQIFVMLKINSHHNKLRDKDEENVVIYLYIHLDRYCIFQINFQTFWWYVLHVTEAHYPGISDRVSFQGNLTWWRPWWFSRSLMSRSLYGIQRYGDEQLFSQLVRVIHNSLIYGWLKINYRRWSKLLIEIVHITDRTIQRFLNSCQIDILNLWESYVFIL